jgi:uncharacterized protein
MDNFIEVSQTHRFAHIVCPISKQALFICKDETWLYCLASGLAYPIRNHIPVMLPSEARPFTDDERAVLKAKF